MSSKHDPSGAPTDSKTPNQPHIPAAIDLHTSGNQIETTKQTDTAAAQDGRWVVTRNASHTTLMLNGNHADGTAIRQLYETIIELLDEGNARILLDLTRLNAPGSGLLGMLVTIHKKCLGSGSQCHVAVPQPTAMHAFHVLNLQRILNLFDNTEAAVDAFK